MSKVTSPKSSHPYYSYSYSFGQLQYRLDFVGDRRLHEITARRFIIGHKCTHKCNNHEERAEGGLPSLHAAFM